VSTWKHAAVTTGACSPLPDHASFQASQPVVSLPSTRSSTRDRLQPNAPRTLPRLAFLWATARCAVATSQAWQSGFLCNLHPRTLPALWRRDHCPHRQELRQEQAISHPSAPTVVSTLAWPCGIATQSTHWKDDGATRYTDANIFAMDRKITTATMCGKWDRFRRLHRLRRIKHTRRVVRSS